MVLLLALTGGAGVNVGVVLLPRLLLKVTIKGGCVVDSD